MNFRSFQEALNYAIAREHDAGGLYRALAGRARQAATRAMLEDLAGQEGEHQARLEGLSRSSVGRMKSGPLAIADLVETKEVAFEPGMDFVAALRLAVHKEDESVRLYESLRRETGDSVVKKLFAVLVEQEQGHRFRLQEELDSVVLKDV